MVSDKSLPSYTVLFNFGTPLALEYVADARKTGSAVVFRGTQAEAFAKVAQGNAYRDQHYGEGTQEFWFSVEPSGR